MRHAHTTRTLALILALVAGLVMVDMAAVQAAPSKDRDGTRMRARRAVVSKAIKGKLGPKDKHDWRFIEVDKPGKLSLTLKFKPTETPIKIIVTDASGKVLAKDDKGKGKLALSLKTTPGIYYIDVQTKGDKAIEYTLDLSFK